MHDHQMVAITDAAALVAGVAVALMAVKPVRKRPENRGAVRLKAMSTAQKPLKNGMFSSDSRPTVCSKPLVYRPGDARNGQARSKSALYIAYPHGSFPRNGA